MQNFLHNQTQNKFLYFPFLMTAGAVTYFSYSTEPTGWICYICLVLCSITIFIKIPILLRALTIIIFGFCYACTFTNLLNTPILPHDIRDTSVTGIVSNIEYTPRNTQIYLNIPVSDIGLNGTRATIRVSINNDNDIKIPQIGDNIYANIALFKPKIPDIPNGFDFARWAYFNNLTATGYIKSYETINHSSNHNIHVLRTKIHQSANSFLTDALILGYKNAVSQSEKTTWTTTGIGHVWSISGFHITLISGWLYLIFYTFFRCIPQITRRIPAKIPALLCTGNVLAFYLLLSGTNIATFRAFLMTILAFTAFVFGRRVFSMRNVCIAFCVLFLINPHSVMQIGFQLSFSAIFGLTWLWSDIKPQMPKNNFFKFIYAALLTAIVATIFTAPFVIMHFHIFPTYGLFGNLILLPIFSIAIMPMVAIGTLTTLFGWPVPLDIAHNIYQHTLLLANYIANLPISNLIISDIPNTAVFFIIMGLMCIILLRTKYWFNKYIIACIFVIIGITLTIITSKPVFFSTNDHELVGFVENNQLSFNHASNKRHQTTFNTWKNTIGVTNDKKNRRHHADHGVHTFNTDKFKLVYIQKFVPLMKNIEYLCNDKTLDFIVSYFHIDAPQCNAKILRGGFTITSNGYIKYIITKRRWHNPPK